MTLTLTNTNSSYNIVCTCTAIMTEEDVIKMHESKAAKKLPVGFIAQDVKKAHANGELEGALQKASVLGPRKKKA